jgi:hypothetical protein
MKLSSTFWDETKMERMQSDAYGIIYMYIGGNTVLSPWFQMYDKS